MDLPPDAGVDDVKEVFLAVRENELKGSTVFRSGARPEQVLGDGPLKAECLRECGYVADRGR